MLSIKNNIILIVFLEKKEITKKFIYKKVQETFLIVGLLSKLTSADANKSVM